jgi:hypothetical protein
LDGVGHRPATAEGEARREYLFSLDPEVEILRMEAIGMWSTVYSLYGDGRLSISCPRCEDLQLSYVERDELLRGLVDGGLLEYDAAAVKEEMKQNPLVYHSSESGGIVVTILLDDYRGPGHDSGPAQARIVMGTPAPLAEHYTNIEEIQAVAAFADRMDDYRRVSRAVGEDP